MAEKGGTSSYKGSALFAVFMERPGALHVPVWLLQRHVFAFRFPGIGNFLAFGIEAHGHAAIEVERRPAGIARGGKAHPCAVHGVGQSVRGIGAEGVFDARRVLVLRLEHEGQINAVGRAESAVVAGALPGKGIGPGIAAGLLLAFQNLVGGHSEDEVGLKRREQIAGGIAAACLAVAVHDVGGEARGVHEVLERVFSDLVDGSARHGVVAPFLFGRTDHDVQILGRAFGNGVHGALHENVAVEVGLEHRNIALKHAAPFGILAFGGGKSGEREQFFRGKRGYGFAAVFNAVEVQQFRSRHGSLLFVVLRHGRGTLENGAAEKALRFAGGNKRGDVRGARGLAEHRNIVGIASEGGNVVLYPAQSEYHIAQGEVGGYALDFKKAVDVHAIVDGHEHHAVLSEGRTVEAYVVVVAAGAAAAGNIDHDRAFRLSGRGAPDVQAQAVAAAEGLALAVGLKRNVAGGDGIDNAVPGRNGFRKSQDVLALIRRHAAGNASEYMYAVHDKTAYASFNRFDDGTFRGMCMEGHGAHESHSCASIQKLTSVHVQLLMIDVWNPKIRTGERTDFSVFRKIKRRRKIKLKI